MEFKLFNEVPVHVGAEWHKDRQVADHINEPGHRERLLETVELVADFRPLYGEGFGTGLSDWGAGNGGLLHEIVERFPRIRAWGYDLMPSNVDYAKSVYDVDVQLMDVVAGEPRAGAVVILTEILEHLVKPHSLLRVLRQHQPGYVIASSPAFETPENHYEFHLYAWTNESYRLMFERAGYRVLRHFVTACNGTQFIVATPAE